MKSLSVFARESDPDRGWWMGMQSRGDREGWLCYPHSQNGKLDVEVAG